MENLKSGNKNRHRVLEIIDFIGTQKMSARQRALLDKKVDRALREYNEAQQKKRSRY
jgi:hypothetical protein